MSHRAVLSRHKKHERGAATEKGKSNQQRDDIGPAERRGSCGTDIIRQDGAGDLKHSLANEFEERYSTCSDT